MKKMLLCGVLIALLSSDAGAQKQQKSGASKRATPAGKKTTVHKSTPKSADSSTAGKTYNLTHTNNSAALGSSINNRYFIADTTLRVLNYRAATNGLGPDVTLRQITDVGKGAYGIFKGRLTLMPLGARSSGAITGNGSVGTGTSLGVMGSSGPSMGLNGKNPYAGSSIYGTPRLGSILNDSTKNRRNRN